MILLWGLPADGPLRAVHAVLRARGEPVQLLNQHAVASTALDLYVGPAVFGTLRLHDEVLALEAITAVYARPYDIRQVPALRQADPHGALWRHALPLDDALQTWIEVTPARVVNRPSAMASNGSKPYQAALIRAVGLEVPDTLVTNDPDAALAFCEPHRSVIYKSTSGVRSIVSRLAPEEYHRLKDVVHCPTQFQEYVAGTDCRVHVVGDRLFAAEIASDADDYRYAARSGHSVDIRPVTLERDLTAQCRRLAAGLGLPVAGIDLRRTPEGRWVCFEVNPSPGFTFYQEATGQKIAEAVADLLAAQSGG